MMRLSEFILGETETIVAEWEALAATLRPAADGMTSLALRDHRGEASGLGLGLYIVRAISTTHGGDVEVHCDAGETTFTVSLPRTATCRRDAARRCDRPDRLTPS
jgi:signal transduction histidine kinase